MAAQRKMQPAGPTPAETQVAAPSPTAARARAHGAAPASSPVHDHLRRIEASFAEPPAPAPYPLAVRLAIMGGAPLALWAVLIVGVAATVRAIGA